MHKLVQGVHEFQTKVFANRRELFERLATEQRPETLFITCSDSRFSPNLITQTSPGELFILRNAGNLVPPWSSHEGGEAATIEFAVAELGVRDIVVCGHTQCGAMRALLAPEKFTHLPSVSKWLQHAEATRQIVRESYSELEPAARHNVAVQENVLVQLENLRTHPTVAVRLKRGALNLHGWVYKLEDGGIFTFDPACGQFTRPDGGSSG